jgi:hypothetical protein
MTPKGVVDRFRLDLADDLTPPLWTDIEICGYLHDAQQMLCRKVEGIRDATSDVTQIEIASNTPWVDVDPSVLRIRAASLVSTGKPVRVLSYEDVVGTDGTTHAWPFNPTEMALTGVVVCAIIGMEDEKLRLVRIPAASDTLQLLVERLPVIPLSIEKDIKELPDEFEVREEHHLALLLWMKHLAYSKQDVETFDERKAANYEKDFLAYCETARAEKSRRNSKPRLIQYGGL